MQRFISLLLVIVIVLVYSLSAVQANYFTPGAGGGSCKNYPHLCGGSGGSGGGGYFTP